jgi:DNA (cytosine-5)-methyltransferase 1
MKADGLEALVENIERELHGRTLNLLAGGPPCQGFSTAGKWNPDDARNTLLFKLLDFVNILRPEYLLVENVLGIQSILKGKLFESFLGLLNSSGYTTQVFRLKAEQFGVPQRRRRIFIIANRNDTSIKAPEAKLAPIVRGRTRYDAHVKDRNIPPPVTVAEAISDLPELAAGSGEDVIEYNIKWVRSDYQRFMRDMLSLDDFLLKRSRQG